MPCVDTEQSDVNDIEGMLVREKNLCCLAKKRKKNLTCGNAWVVYLFTEIGIWIRGRASKQLLQFVHALTSVGSNSLQPHRL